MSDKKQVFLSLETARKMYKSVPKHDPNNEGGTHHIHVFLLDNFTKEELEAEELPKSWKELRNVKGYFVTTECKIHTADCPTISINRNVFPTKELAEASLALSQLLQLRDVYNGDWKVNYNDAKDKFIIYNSHNQITCGVETSVCLLLSFKNENLRDEFYKNFKDLITTALPLL